MYVAQVNALDGVGQTALHRVCQQGSMQACRLLLGYGVDPTVVSQQGYTAAQLAPDDIQKMLRGQSSGLCQLCHVNVMSTLCQ